jgi:hypothetical protein
MACQYLDYSASGGRMTDELERMWKEVPITMAAQSKARTVLAAQNTGVVGSNPTRGVDVCMRLFCL